MASVKFYIRGNQNPSKITTRFKINSKKDFRKATPILINPDYFNNRNGKVRKIAHFQDKENIQRKLDLLEEYIFRSYNELVSNAEEFNKSWFKRVIDDYFDPTTKKNEINSEKALNTLLINYTKNFIKGLSLKTNDRTGEVGVSNSTLKKYQTIENKIVDFQEYMSEKYQLKDVNLRFREQFLKFLLDDQKLSKNTAGRYLVFIKTICLDARKMGYEVSKDLDFFKGFKTKTKKIYLNTEDLAKIENHTYESVTLSNARDWLIIGCYIGQRAGDLLHLTKKNIIEKKGKRYISLQQQKTKKTVIVPIHPKVETILNKNEGDFPHPYTRNTQSSLTLFNRYIKQACSKAKLNQIVSGSKINPKTGRKEDGDFEKWKLVTSHICRRSFATNFYGDIPTPYLINVTGHSSEREFLNYIGKSPLDYAEQLGEIWS